MNPHACGMYVLDTQYVCMDVPSISMFVYCMVYYVYNAPKPAIISSRGLWREMIHTRHQGISDESLSNISWLDICCWPVDALFPSWDFPVTVIPCSFR